MSTSIHPTATIEDGATLEEGVSVGICAYIGANVHLGKNVSVGHYAFVDGHTTMGEGTKIFPYAKVGVIPQDLKFEGEPGRLVVGKNNTIRESSSLEIGTKGGNMETLIGDNNLFMMSSHVAHDSLIADNVIIGMFAGTAGHVEIGSNVRISPLAGIHQYVRLGANAFIGMSGIVSRDILPYSLIDQHGKLIGVNTVGIRRISGNEKAKEIKKIFEKIYLGETGTFDSRIDDLSRQAISPEARAIIDFAQAESKRGLFSEWQK